MKGSIIICLPSLAGLLFQKYAKSYYFPRYQNVDIYSENKGGSSKHTAGAAENGANTARNNVGASSSMRILYEGKEPKVQS